MLQENKISEYLTIYRGHQVEMDLFEKFFLYSKMMSLFYLNPFGKEEFDNIEDKCRCMIETFLLNNRFDNNNRIICRDMFTSFCENINNQKRFNLVNIYPSGIQQQGLNAGIEIKELYCCKNMLFQPNALLFDMKTKKYFFYVPINLVDNNDILFVVPNVIYQQRVLHSQLKNILQEDNIDHIEFLLDIINPKEQDKKSNELKTTLYQCICVSDNTRIKDYTLINLSTNEKKTMCDYLDDFDENNGGEIINREKYEEYLEYLKFIDTNREIFDNVNIHFSKMFDEIAKKYSKTYKINFIKNKDIEHCEKEEYIKHLINIGKDLSNTTNENNLYYQKILDKNYFDDVEEFVNPNKIYDEKNKDNSHIYYNKY